MATRRAQAMVELAVGMFAVVLVISAVTLFTVYIVRSLRVQNTARGASPEPAEPVEVDGFAEKFFTGTKTLSTKERVAIPSNAILQ